MRTLPLCLILSLFSAPLLAAPTRALEDCAECLPGTRKATLCAPHAEAEKAGLKGCTAALKKGGPAERLAALRELAALTEAHTNAPSPALVKTLSRGLDDESHEVVLGTIELLGQQHPEAVLAVYADLAKEHAKRYANLSEEIDELNYELKLRNLKAPDGLSKKQQAGEEKDLAELAELTAERAAIDQATDAISPQLGGMRDARAVKALDALLEQNAREATVQALASVGDLKAAEALHRHLERATVMYKAVSELKDIMDEANELLAEEGKTGVDVQDLYDKAHGAVAATHAGLTQIAKTAGLEADLPEMSTEADEHWGKWLKQNRKALPPALGRMSMPWDE